MVIFPSCIVSTQRGRERKDALIRLGDGCDQHRNLGLDVKVTPEGIPTEIAQATLEIDGSRISFSGLLEPSKPLVVASHLWHIV